MSENLASLLADLEEERTLATVKEALSSGTDPLALVEGLRDGMSLVGERFESKEYFLSDLIMSAEIFNQAITLIQPYIKSDGASSRGAVVLGTVKGDIHDIGKNIVGSLLRCEGYDVHDLGVDVDPAKFVEKVRETGATLVAMSGLLTLAFDAMKETIESFIEAGLRGRVKVIIGGGPVNQAVVDYTGADDYGKDATSAIKLAGHYLN